MSEPTLAEIFRLAIDSRLDDVHVALPCRVESYDAATQCADVLPTVRRAMLDEDGGTTHEDLPVIPNVPILFPRSAAFSATWPIAKGDHVLVILCSSAIGNWRESGEVADPGDLRRHDLSHAVAIPGIAPSAETIPTASDAAVVEVNSPATHVAIGASATDFVAMNAKVVAELQALQNAFSAHTHAAGTLLDSVSGACTGATAVGPSYSAPANVASTKLKSE